MYDLLLGWTAHVSRLRAEQGQDLSMNPSLWNEHDYVAALGIRDLVEKAFALLDADLAAVAREIVSRADADFLSFTTEDGRDLLMRVAGVDVTRQGWWWNRLPQRGLILENMNRYYRSSSGAPVDFECWAAPDN
jgi:hypothetical protein